MRNKLSAKDKKIQTHQLNEEINSKAILEKKIPSSEEINIETHEVVHASSLNELNKDKHHIEFTSS